MLTHTRSRHTVIGQGARVFVRLYAAGGVAAGRLLKGTRAGGGGGLRPSYEGIAV